MTRCSKDLDFLRRRNLRYFHPDFSGGNRVAKYVLDGQTSFAKHVTYYVRDASGNVMAVYEHDLETPESYHLSERHIYGSSRLGMITEKVEFEYVYSNQPAEDLVSTLAIEETVNFELEYFVGKKQYELSNHLGNVLAVISDWKLPVISGASVVSYTTVVVSSQDYSPFGVTLEGRSWSAGYRYGFNGQEKEKEITGSDTHTSAEFWMYDARLGRRWEMDPILVYCVSPYATNYNNPIYNNDPDGDNPIVGAFLGALTEYLGIVGEEMLFENKSFYDANASLTWRDGAKIGAAFIFGGVNGIGKFKSWISNPRNQKILVRIVQVGLVALENALKEVLDEEGFELEDMLIGTLSDLGLGHLLTTKNLDKSIDVSRRNSEAASARAKDLASRKKPHERLVKNANEAKNKAKSEVRTKEIIKNGVQTGQETFKKIASNGAGRAYDGLDEKPKAKKKEKIRKPKIIYCPSF